MKKLSTGEFIERAKRIHGRKYDYSLVDYQRNNQKVTIVCKTHGEFEKTPNKHLLGEGCPKCSGRYRRTAKDFLSEARQVHGYRYDYSKVDYKNTKRKVTIACPEHGDFLQTPESHLAGQGCPRCAGTQRLTTEEFIHRAKKVHGGKYDYSQVKYKNAKTKVTIICRKHGEFQQYSDNHFRGVGCPKCSGNKPLTTEEFVAQAKTIHGDKYDYSKVNYARSADKVKISCPIHGDFTQKPNHHLAGVGCPYCGNEIISQKKKLTQDEFLKRSKIIHGDKYDYSKVKYVDTYSKVKIICPEHGEFEQAAGTHFLGSGCPACAITGADFNASGVMYYVRVDTHAHRLWKVGITNRTVKKRFIGDFRKITVLKVWKYEHLRDAYSKEQDILQKYADWLYDGIDKPLSKGGNTELFTRDVLGLDPEYK